MFAPILATAATHPIGTSGFDGLAETGKIIVALLVVVGIILACAWILRRMGGAAGMGNGQRLHVVSARSLGVKSKLVVVEVGGVQLVLGVTPASINVLHKLPAVKREDVQVAQDDGSFALRFKDALKQNLGLRKK